MNTRQCAGEAASEAGIRRRVRASRTVVFELLAILVLAGLFVPWGSLLSRERDDDQSMRSLAYALLSGDVSDSPWEIAAFDEASGEVVARIPTAHQPMLLPHPSGAQLYLVETRWEHPTRGTTSLSIVDTATWTRRVRVAIPIAHAPLALALSPDATRLFVRMTNMLGDYWLDVYDARTLERPAGRQRIELPRGCGAGRLLQTAHEEVLVCGGVTEGSAQGVIPTQLALHFINPTTLQIVASVSMDGGGILRSGRIAGIATTADGTAVYVVFSNLQLLEIDAVTHEIVQNVRTYSTWEQDVISVASVADGALFVAVRDTVAPGTFAQLRRFALPTLKELPALSLPDGPRFAPGPDGSLYRWKVESTDLIVRNVATGAERIVSLGGALPTIITIVRSGER